MNQIPIEILCEILSKISHQKLLDISIVCKKWYELIKTKKYLGAYDNFINRCVNNSFLFDEIVTDPEFNNLNNCIEMETRLFYGFKSETINLLNIGYYICKKLNNEKMKLKIKKLYPGIVSKHDENILLRYGIITKNIDVINIFIQICKDNVGQTIYSWLEYESNYDCDYGCKNIFTKQFYNDKNAKLRTFLLRIIKMFKPHIIEEIIISACNKSDHDTYDFLFDNGYQYFKRSNRLLLFFVGRFSSNRVISFIEKNNLQKRVKNIKLISNAIQNDRCDLVKYFLNINPKYASCSKLIRLTVHNFNSENTSVYEWITNFVNEMNRTIIIKLLLKFNSSYTEKRLTMMYMIKLKHFNFAKIFIRHGVTININPACFIIKRPINKKILRTRINSKITQ